MASSADAYKQQLPNYQPWTFERILVLIGAIAGVIGLFAIFLGFDKSSSKQNIFIAELMILVVLLIAYIYYSTRRKLHRYAQSVFFVHYVNHIVRDYIGQLSIGKTPEINGILENVVDATANCFSVLMGRRVRCSIKAFASDDLIKTVVRDRISSSQSAETAGAAHHLNENTDFRNLWFGQNGCTRYFLSNNLVKLWDDHNYETSSFKWAGNPQRRPGMGLSSVNWTLPYKACIVWPIRYIPDDRKWPLLTEAEVVALPKSERPQVWGFLCVDSKATNAFDELHAPELGAAIADAIFSALQAAEMQVEQKRLISGA